MSDTIISVEGLGKKYVLSHQGGGERGGYSRFSEKLEGWMKKPFAAVAGGRRREVEGNLPPTSFHLPQPSHEEFWALKDVSFEVKRGEVVGIIGRNGAGKSTLLKILSRITEPSEGRVTLRGRVASLLEVGTGFHPELTGRENIFLNGAILGMTKAEIKKKFDEIVAFAEVERFLDTPVKRYSSGMYVRLAFAVAAHLEPEILVVDEVLAVGDIEFQNKCLGKMKSVSQSGRTVLFVTHNLASVTNLCNRGILLQKGQVQKNGSAGDVVEEYMKISGGRIKGREHILHEKKSIKQNTCSITKIETLGLDDTPLSIVHPFDSLKIRVSFYTDQSYSQGSVLIELCSLQGVKIAKIETNPSCQRPFARTNGINSIDCIIKSLPLMPGEYYLQVGLAIYNVKLLEYLDNAGIIQVIAAPSKKIQKMLGDANGLIALEHVWE